MAIEKDFFRQVMGRFATGVTVVTTKSQEKLAGLTVNAFCSVSLNPPLVLVCVDLMSATLPVMRESGVFAVNILTDKQEYLSRCFATPSRERFECFCHAGYHVAATGAPIIDDTLAFIDARVVAEYPGGDHVIFIGQVEALGITGQAAFADEEDRERSTVVEYGSNGTEKVPLAYYLGQYRHLANDYQKPSLPTPSVSTHKDV
ncbi:MAG TPA: flavin reductase family protein [Ktedonobacteraceae bacterium]|jgi:flavin reductase (DIM6/NTAB) family NADH-FMN oxidoreductase RutF|nr:flavin reductase family protein [Ktedonobacteraceae bacterium]